MMQRGGDAAPEPDRARLQSLSRALLAAVRIEITGHLQMFLFVAAFR
jgi:hypothetical protein